jgi:hypothetical protein
MKTTFKMGKISFTAKKEGGAVVTRKLVGEDNVKLEKPIDLESTDEKGVDISFEMESLETTFEAEPAEMIEIYKTLGPVLKDLVKTLAVLNS